MKCLKCGADATPGLSATWCDSCVVEQRRSREIGTLFGLLAIFGIPALILFGAIHACSRLYSSDSHTAVSINGYANLTGDIWCMESKESLDKLVELAAKNAYDEMNQLFVLQGVTTLRKGQSVKVIDESLGGFKVRTFGGQDCWVTSNMLSKEDGVSSESADRSPPIPPVPQQKATAIEAFKAAPGEELIGRWRDAPEEGSSTYVIVQSKGKFYMDWTVGILAGAQSVRDELKAIDSANGRKFVEVDSGTGDYYVITRDGSLREFDREGYIRTARRVQK